MPEIQEGKEESLQSAVAKAVEAQDKSESVQEELEETREEATESTESTEVHQEIDQDSLDMENGKMLMRALRDPNQAPQIIDWLARQAGYTKQEIQNIQGRQEIKELTGDINSILERNLGEEFKFLAPKLGPAIKESIEAMMLQNNQNDTADLRARLEKQEFRDIQAETTQAHNSLAKEWFGSDDMPTNVVKAMSQAMDEFPPTDPNMSPDRYYRKIFSLVVGDLGLTKRGRGNSERILRNQSDYVARNLSSQSRGVTPTVDGSNPRRLSIKDAVALAMEQVDQASRK